MGKPMPEYDQGHTIQPLEYEMVHPINTVHSFVCDICDTEYTNEVERELRKLIYDYCDYTGDNGSGWCCKTCVDNKLLWTKSGKRRVI